MILGLALLFSPDAADAGDVARHAPTWDDLAFALPLAMLAYTGLETVANLAEETREPGRTLPRSLFSAIGLVVVLTVLDRGRRALRLPGRERADRARRRVAEGAARGHRRRAPGRSLPGWLGDVLRVYVGLTGALVLLAAATTSISGFTRLAHSLGEHGQLPRGFGRLNRRTLVSPQAILAAAAISIALVIGSGAARRRRRLPREPLLVRRAARLRGGAARRDPAARAEPDLPRPFRAPIGGAAHRRAARDRGLGSSRW